MHKSTFFPVFFILPLCLLLSCDLIEPTERPYNSAAHPPAVGDLATLGIMPGEKLTGEVFVFIDSSLGDPGDLGTILVIDDQPVAAGSFPSGIVGFDTRAYPEGVHTLTVGFGKPGGGPSETGLLGYLGVSDILFSGEVFVRQTVPFELPARPFVPWGGGYGDRPAVDGERNLLYVIEQDSVKAFSTSTNMLLRSRCVTGSSFGSSWGGRHCALSADGTRLVVHSVLNDSSSIIVLDALTFESLAASPVEFPVGSLACGEGNYLYVASYSTDPYSNYSPLLRVLNIASLAQIAELTLPGPPGWMVITKDRKTLFFASTEVIRVSVENGIPILQAHRSTAPVTAFGCSPDGQRLFLAFEPSPFYDVTYVSRMTIANASTLDSIGCVALGRPSLRLRVLDILPSGEDLFAVLSVPVVSSTSRIAKYSRLLAMTASWDIENYPAPWQIQLSGDGRFLYASGGALCIPIP